jgi:hypothetical protein
VTTLALVIIRGGGAMPSETLADFLLKRIAEDEQNWRRLARDDEFREVVLLGCVIQADRVLADCDAKRRIVEMHESHTVQVSTMRPPYCVCDGESFPCETLLLLALPYAAHESFQPEWRV